MYYEERWIGGKFCWRTSPDGAWTAYTANELAHRYQAELQRAHDLQRALDAERARVKELERERDVWRDKTKHLGKVSSDVQAQLRQVREALVKCRRELWHCNHQLKGKGAHEGHSVTEALSDADTALAATLAVQDAPQPAPNERVEYARLELAALFSTPGAPTLEQAKLVCENKNPADAQCILNAYEALREAAQDAGVVIRRIVDDSFGSQMEMCSREDCGLQVVRPGQFQCLHPNCYDADQPHPTEERHEQR